MARAKIAAAFLLALCASTSCLATDATPPPDFRGTPWGSYPPEDKGLKYLGFGMAQNPSPSLAPFAGLAVRDETYFFNQRSQRLVAGSLIFEGNKFEQVKAYLISQYGKPDFTHDDAFVSRWLFKDPGLWGYPAFMRIELNASEKATILDFNTEK